MTQIIKICQRIETNKENINKSSLGKILFSLAKSWKLSDQGDLIEASSLVRELIADWKVKYYGKTTTKSEPSKDNETDKALSALDQNPPNEDGKIEVPSIHKTGVATRDRIR